MGAWGGALGADGTSTALREPPAPWSCPGLAVCRNPKMLRKGREERKLNSMVMVCTWGGGAGESQVQRGQLTCPRSHSQQQTWDQNPISRLLAQCSTRDRLPSEQLGQGERAGLWVCSHISLGVRRGGRVPVPLPSKAGGNSWKGSSFVGCPWWAEALQFPSPVTPLQGFRGITPLTLGLPEGAEKESKLSKVTRPGSSQTAMCTQERGTLNSGFVHLRQTTTQGRGAGFLGRR